MHTKMRKTLFLALAAAAVVGSAFLVDPMVHMRQKYELTSEPVEGISPQLVLATRVFGWARGIIIDVIWIRMEELKREGKFFELAQLADWACKLAPRIPEVWDIQAWNMAYNISYHLDYMPDRWSWVWSGIKLYRDQAIPNNPNAYELYYNLSWTLFHKIGEQDDNAHMFYKARFALLMQEVLGGPGFRPQLQELADAPGTREDLLQDAGVKKLVDRCREFHDFDIVDGYFPWYHGTENVGKRVRNILEVHDEIETVPQELREFLDEYRQNEELAKTLQKVEVFARARRLREEYKMDPTRMLGVVDMFKSEQGVDPPLDWRSPYPHAMYWALLGLEKLQAAEIRRRSMEGEFGLERALAHGPWEKYPREEQDIFQVPRIQLSRMVYYPMQSLVQRGRLLFDTSGGYLYEVGPEYRLADAVLPVYEALLVAPAGPGQYGGVSSGARRSVESAYLSFLQRGVAEFYFMGDKVKSQDYFKRIAKRFPDKLYGHKTWKAYIDWRVDDYQTMMVFAASRNRLRALFVRSFYYLGCGDHELSARFELRAKNFKIKYDEDEKETNLRGNLPYDKVRDSALMDILAGVVRFKNRHVLTGLEQELKKVLPPERFEQLMANAAAMRRDLNITTPEDVRENLTIDSDH